VTRKKKRYKRKPFKPINRDDFKELRLINNLTVIQTAELLQVTGRTIALWESGAVRVPYSAFKLLRVLANGELLPSAWKGWRVCADTLYTPTGRAFKAHELTYLSNYITMARYWLAECKEKASHRQVTTLRAHLRLVSDAPLPLEKKRHELP
jgi:DNA-binding transcriptional regulator YiaG